MLENQPTAPIAENASEIIQLALGEAVRFQDNLGLEAAYAANAIVTALKAAGHDPLSDKHHQDPHFIYLRGKFDQFVEIGGSCLGQREENDTLGSRLTPKEESPTPEHTLVSKTALAALLSDEALVTAQEHGFTLEEGLVGIVAKVYGAFQDKTPKSMPRFRNVYSTEIIGTSPKPGLSFRYGASFRRGGNGEPMLKNVSCEYINHKELTEYNETRKKYPSAPLEGHPAKHATRVDASFDGTKLAGLEVRWPGDGKAMAAYSEGSYLGKWLEDHLARSYYPGLRVFSEIVLHMDFGSAEKKQISIQNRNTAKQPQYRGGTFSGGVLPDEPLGVYDFDPASGDFFDHTTSLKLTMQDVFKLVADSLALIPTISTTSSE